MALFVSLKDKIRSEFRDTEIGSDIFNAYRQIELWALNLERYLTNNIGVVPPGVAGPSAGSQDVGIGTMVAYTRGPGSAIDTTAGTTNNTIITCTFPLYANHTYKITAHISNTIVTAVPPTGSASIAETGAALLAGQMWAYSQNLGGWAVGNIVTGTLTTSIQAVAFVPSYTITLRVSAAAGTGALRTLANAAEIIVVRTG